MITCFDKLKPITQVVINRLTFKPTKSYDKQKLFKRMDYGWKHNETLTIAIKIIVIVKWWH